MTLKLDKTAKPNGASSGEQQAPEGYRPQEVKVVCHPAFGLFEIQARERLAISATCVFVPWWMVEVMNMQVQQYRLQPGAGTVPGSAPTPEPDSGASNNPVSGRVIQ